MSSLAATGSCPKAGCQFSNQLHSRQVHHTESHWILYLCACGYLRSYRDTTTKHGRTQHRSNRTPVVQVDKSNREAVHNFNSGLPDSMPTIPVRSNELSQACRPDGPSRPRTPLRKRFLTHTRRGAPIKAHREGVHDAISRLTTSTTNTDAHSSGDCFTQPIRWLCAFHYNTHTNLK